MDAIQGLLDEVMGLLGVVYVEETAGRGTAPRGTYHTAASSDEPALIPGQQAAIFMSGVQVGMYGIVHPEVLAAFEIPYSASVLELELKHFINHL
ncbi:hypothetical protein VaNZ11_003408 [Volvox africanus]|uniref:Phenylalanyl tRNA synthetase beta chain core domain-containing protein n=1 Tax=Volvox africanus TaxID=51714 RepID=A0ABQ5RV30_9CHLO|nr:hypothetical protein VaNZ11_003408 [Volvox africanus]